MRKKYSAFVRLLVVLSMVLALIGVMATPVSATVTGIDLDKPYYPIGDTVTAMVFADAATSVNVVFTTSNASPDSDTKATGTLTQIGATGVYFKAVSIPTAAREGGVADDGTLEVLAWETITATSTVIATAKAVPTKTTVAPGIVAFLTEINSAVGTVSIQVTDANANLTSVADVVSVTVTSVEGGDSELVSLAETGFVTGIFTGTVTLLAATAATGTVNDGKLAVGVQTNGNTRGGTVLAATVSSLVDRFDVHYIGPGSDKFLGGAFQADDTYATARAVFDAEAPVASILSASYAAGVITITLSAKDDPLAAGYTLYPTAATNVGQASGAMNIELSVNAGPWTLTDSVQPALTTTQVIRYISAPTEGVYSIKARGIDRALNTQSVFTAGAPGSGISSISVPVDATKPVITAAWAERVERGTDTDLTKVHIGQTATIYATVVEAASGIPITINFNDTTNVITVTDSEVVVDATAMTPSAALLAPILAAIDGGGNLTDAAKVVVGTGTWSKVVTVPGTVGVKTYSVTATDDADPTPLVSVAATITVNVVSEVTSPVMVSSAVTYQAGIEDKAGDWLIISVDATDDISGVNTVKADLTALAPPSSAGVGRSEDWNSSTATWASPLTGTLVLAAQPLIAYGTTAKPDTWHLKLYIGSAVTAGDKTVTITVTDKAGKTGTGTVIVKVVTERTHWTVSLASGWNFISLPRTPVDSSLAAALAGTPITEIHTNLGGVWSGAQLVDGVWTGTLTSLSAGKGYVALASAAGTLTETFTAPQPLEAPPSVELPAGWSLIGFASLALETAIDADAYLNSVATAWSVIYSPSEGWTSDRPDVDGTLTNVQASKAYWVFMSKAATLAP